MSSTLEQTSRTFIDLVDFKWLMAGVGWWVSLSRLQSDKAYADECLQRALSSGSRLLRQRAAWLVGPGVRDDDFGRGALAPMAA
jgi:hypothetical protein